MSQKKIIFLIIVAVVIIGLSLGLMMLSSQEKKVTQKWQVNIWINEGTTDDFQKLINGFYAANPDHKNINVTVTKQSTTTTSWYNTRLLTAIADKAGPDIFMLPRGEDSNLESQVSEIPGEFINIGDFERQFDAVFSDLVKTEKSENDKTTKQYLRGIPLGYETLGVFYNRSLLRAGSPKEWNQVELLYNQFPTGKFPTNLGLGKNFVPNVIDILPLFFAKNDIYSYAELKNITSPFQEYYSYGDISVGGLTADSIYSQVDNLRRTEKNMSDQTPFRSTIDEFMQGNIGMILGYQSLIFELENAQKRAGSNQVGELIYTDSIPQFVTSQPHNIARYNYFAISKNSENKDASVVFMNYLMSEDAQRIAMEIYPHLIPAQTKMHLSVQGKMLSEKFPKAKIDPFLSQPGMNYSVFDYGFKETFKSILDSNWDDLANRSTLSGVGDEIVKWIQAQMTQYKK